MYYLVVIEEVSRVILHDQPAPVSPVVWSDQ